MRGPLLYMPDDKIITLGNPLGHLDAQPSLIPTRIRTIYPHRPIGKHISVHCTAVDGRTYHCKSDADGRPIRATEWIAQSLARHLGIAVPDFQIMDDDNGETYFGSREAIAIAAPFEMNQLLTQITVNELGAPTNWLGPRLSGLYALDLFLNNPDRNLCNFVLEKSAIPNVLCAIDFADSHLEDITSDRFPVATCNTVCNGRFINTIHEFSLASASDMIESIRLVPTSVIDGFIKEMPNDWMANDEKKRICEAWSGSQFDSCLSALRAGLEDGSRR